MIAGLHLNCESICKNERQKVITLSAFLFMLPGKKYIMEIKIKM